MTDSQLTGQDSPFPEQEHLEDMVQHVIALARKAGADAVENFVNNSAPTIPPQSNEPAPGTAPAPVSPGLPAPREFGVMETGFLGLPKFHKERFTSLDAAVLFASNKRGDQTPIAFY